MLSPIGSHRLDRRVRNMSRRCAHPAVNPSRDWRSGQARRKRGDRHRRQRIPIKIGSFARKKIGLAQSLAGQLPAASNCLSGNNQPHPEAAIEACGYRNVKNLTRDPVGNWAAEAERGGVELAVVLQVNGEIAEE